ncbi:terpenoid synthase [Artomyces pyxidatus]|uniref:Terpenoid synthase n=1 Tax=Artomyces pyxidatus TaxID=48021 RepID=A0ACB8TBW1_9AGAM|nr:terpenoid synthase [Artomyces pyxidatus]
MSLTSQLRLPEPLVHWPWKRQMNAHYDEVKAESDAWVHGFHVFSPKAQRAFDKGNFALLAALTWPLHDKEALRIGCDLNVLLFVIDDFTDRVDGDGVQTYVNMVMDAMRNPHKPRPAGESVIGEIARQFWVRAIKRASTSSQSRFLRAFNEYMTALVDEATDRFDDNVRSIDAYLALRRRTGGPYTCFFVTELGADFPDEVIFHPPVARLTQIAAEAIVTINDLYSYNIEQSAGHQNHNLVTAVMQELHCDMGQAVDWIAEYHKGLLSQFIEGRDKLPRFGEKTDEDLARYVEGLAHWIRGSDCWSFEGKRYFGDKGPEIQKHRIVDLLPRVGMSLATPMMAPVVAAELSLKSTIAAAC